MSFRPHRRSNAITNSPIVRALIKPLMSLVPPVLPLPPPSAKDLLSTQPTATGTGTVVLVNGKRGREEQQEDEEEGEERRRAKGKGRSEEGEKEKDEGEVNVCYNAKTLPSELKKYWTQRYRLFSLFDEGCQLDREGWFSVTPEAVAAQIAERCRSNVVVDAFCGVGGNAIQFAFTCERVIAIDNSPVRLACATHNAKIYGVADRITFVLADFPTWAREYVQKEKEGRIKDDEKVDVVFLSPPWGGIDYLRGNERDDGSPEKKRTKIDSNTTTTGTNEANSPAPPFSTPQNQPYPLSALAPIHGARLFALAREMTPHVAYYLPRNVDVEELASLSGRFPRLDKTEEEEGVERVEIEEEWMGNRLKAVTAYFGDLARTKLEKDEVQGGES